MKPPTRLKALLRSGCASGLLLFAGIGHAAEPQDAVQRALLERQQQADEQALRMRQQLDRVRVPAVDARRQGELDRRQIEQRLRTDALDARQRQDMRAAQQAGVPPAGSAATDPARLARERQLESER